MKTTTCRPFGAAGAILEYLTETQKTSLGHIDRLTPYRVGQTLEIDEATRRSLEITNTMREGRREGSLLDVLDRTITAMGSRLLGDWVGNPLTDLKAIDERLDAVAELVDDARLGDELREQLKRIYDVERLLARVTTGRASPRDLNFLGRTLRTLPTLKAKLTARTSALLSRLEAELDLCPDIRSQLDAALEEECPLVSREGGFIRGGFNAELDALRELTTGGKQWIARYQAEEAERTGIPNLKVGFNKVFGYYLEITHAHRDKAPARLHPQADGQERRTLHHAGAERVRGKGPFGRRKGQRPGARAVPGTSRSGDGRRQATAAARRRPCPRSTC